MRTHTVKAGRIAAVLATASVALLSLPAAPAGAHGERAQEATLRARAVSFYDVRYTHTDGSPLQGVSTGERFVVSGRFYVPRSWPHAVKDPDVASLTVVAPGPVVLVTDRRIGGEFAPQNIMLHKGRAYDFRVELMARRSGRWHVHPMVTVKGSGPLIGPGRWVQVDDGGKFVNEVRLANGDRVDLETFNAAGGAVWHLLYLVPALLLLWHWVVRKPLVPRLAAIQAGARPSDLLEPGDNRITMIAGAASLALVIASGVYASAKWDTIPLQTRHDDPPGMVAGQDVVAKATDYAEYDPRTDALTVTMTLTNRQRTRLDLAEFDTGGGLRFAPGSRAGDIVTAAPVSLAPGERRSVEMTFRGHWADENLIPERETSNEIGGILVFHAPDGKRQVSEITLKVRAAS